jgi:hypothetical protein
MPMFRSDGVGGHVLFLFLKSQGDNRRYESESSDMRASSNASKKIASTQRARDADRIMLCTEDVESVPWLRVAGQAWRAKAQNDRRAKARNCSGLLRY